MKKKGTGGHGRKRLAGKGPTPKASDRTYHQAYRDRIAAEKKATHTNAQRSRAAAKDHYRPHTRAGAELIFGRNPVSEAAVAGVPFKRLFVASTIMKDPKLAKVVERASASGVPLRECSAADLDRLTEGGVHQGIAAELCAYQYLDVMELWDLAVARAEAAGRAASAGCAVVSPAVHEVPSGVLGETPKSDLAPHETVATKPPTHPPLLVALDQITDPHNLGAVLRSAAAFGADGVIIPEHRAASVNAAAWKVSAGAAAIVPVAQATNLTRALQDLKRAGAFVIGLDGGGDVALPDLQLTDVPLVVVTGSEGRGISRLVRDTCDQIVSIPIAPRMESLNAAVATGIALYQIATARRVVR